ncbi:sensor histidine kinase [Limnovirga soli]|nr:histidine kinase [Limnovirga soli]
MANNILSDAKFKIAFSIWWIIWAIIMLAILVNTGLPFSVATITDSIFSNALLAGCCLLISNNMQYYLPRDEKYWYILVISLSLSGGWLLLTKMGFSFLFSGNAAYIHMLQNSYTLRFAMGFLLIGSMAILSVLWYTQQEQQNTINRKNDAARLAKEAELFKLRQQLQPHFLFNSLNSISALTGTQPEKARHMIQQLSDFLRGTLRRDDQQWSTLTEELEYLQLYLDIEKVRFGYRLQTAIQCNEEALTQKLPALLLQPVVENAIKFGLYDTVGEVLITIEAQRLNDILEIKVTNPFDEETTTPLQGTGFGLASIKRRLFLLFARQDLLQTTIEHNNFITTIIIPQPA